MPKFPKWAPKKPRKTSKRIYGSFGARPIDDPYYVSDWYGDFFSIYSGAQEADVNWGSDRFSAARSGSHVTVGMSTDATIADSMRAAIELREGLIQSDLRSVMSRSLTKRAEQIFESIKDAWTASQADSWFTTDEVFSTHAERAQSMLNGFGKSYVQKKVTNEVFELDQSDGDMASMDSSKAVDKVIKRYRDELRKVRFNPDKMETVKLAIKIDRAITAEGDNPSPDGEDGEGESESKGKSKTSVAGGSASDSTEAGSASAGDPSDSTGDKKPESEKPESDKPETDEEREAREKREKELAEAIKEARAAAQKARDEWINAEAEKIAGDIKKKAEEQTKNNQEYRDNVYHLQHNYKMLAYPSTEYPLNHRLKNIVGDIIGGPPTRNARVGTATPRAWRLSIGDTKVFAKPQLTRHNILILVDLSGSMGCWCESCTASGMNSNGRLARDVVVSLSTAFPQSAVYGFCSTSSTNYIVPIESGRFLKCRSGYGDLRGIPDGNPDCAALLFLEQEAANMASTIAVIVSDGSPWGPAPADNKHLTQHTMELAYDFKNRGMKFFSVLINSSDRTLYPSEIAVHINDEEDLPKLDEMFQTIQGQQG